ncbi:TlpA family protein disulfide reductase [Pseudoflavitalea sp. X16]|uniref:TlpA family protein disulfide reductase n=1 Tax=Paraflavitalea devenefica TaxID=2716334 RepID=UPI001421D47B|nr:TlpA disulfide reductase family protein [Paraflavitalea devenefica]NII28870.1 TlpA family protein disulfide reductase [Paraflavitalea devenefica]
MMKLLYAIPLVLIFFIQSAKAQGLPVRHVLLKGKITGNNRMSSFTVFSDNGLILGNNDTVAILPSGHFQKWLSLPASHTGHIMLNYGEDNGVELYLGNVDSMHLVWNANAFFTSIRIGQDTDKLNSFLLKFQQELQPVRDSVGGILDTCASLISFNRVLKVLNHLEYQFLRKEGQQLDSLQYQQCANDIFYRNLGLLVRSPFFNDYKFADLSYLVNFPPIVRYDKRVDRLQQRSYIDKLKGVSTAADSSFAASISERETGNLFWSTYAIIDTSAFRSSYAYRTFLYSYLNNLAAGIHNRRLGKNIIDDVGAYHTWLQSIIAEDRIIDWMVAGKVQYNLMVAGSRLAAQELEKQLAFINDKGMWQELMAIYKLYYTLRPGVPAPAIPFLDQKNKVASLEAYRGKYIYVNFWDSWCAPCIYNIKQYSQAVADKYAGRDIVLLYISLDEDDKLWRKSVQRYKPAGINGRAGEGWRSAFAQQYNIRYVPRYVIINPDGTIRDAQAGDLYSLLMSDPFK